MTYDDEEERPDRPVPARRRAEQRWRMSEPWRLPERRRRRLKIGAVVAAVVAAGIGLAVLGSSSPISSRDVAAVASSGDGYRLLFYGCHGERLLDVTVWPGDPPTTGAFSTGASWLIQADGAGRSGRLEIPIGETPEGYRAVVPFEGLPASPPGGHFTISVQTSSQQMRFRFNESLVSGGSVVTTTGRFPLATYQRDEAAACGT